ncbi:MAG: AAA family ATPase [Megasphaera cerevisiae]|nr:AAA family ATPase [Megasphaera cerevisiae]
MGITEEEFKQVFDYNVYRAFKPIGRKYINNNELYYTTPNNEARAVLIDKILEKKQSKNFNTYTNDDALKAVDIVNNKLEKNYGWNLSKGQAEALTSILSNSEKFIAVEGIAGSGKTTMLEHAQMLLNIKNVKVVGMAFTGKAADAMKTEANIEASTIHRFLNQLDSNKSTKAGLKNSWDFSDVKPAKKPEIWFVDESSMLTDNLLSHVLKAAEKRQSKIIFLGDSHQLLPIGAGNGFARMIEKNQVPVIHMKEITRQENGSELKKAVEVLSGKFPQEKKESLIEPLKNNISELPLRKSRINKIVKDYCSYSLEEQKKTVVLVAQNNDRNEINQKIRKRLIFNKFIEDGKAFDVINNYGKLQKKNFSVGDKILFTKNDWNVCDNVGNYIGVKNGQLGEITLIKDQIICVKTHAGSTIDINMNTYKNIDYAYAMTSYKAQGITVDNALISYDTAQTQSNTRNKFYVDVSRARKNIHIYVDDTAKFEKQIKKFQKKLLMDDFKTKKNNTTLTKEGNISHESTKQNKSHQKDTHQKTR